MRRVAHLGAEVSQYPSDNAICCTLECSEVNMVASGLLHHLARLFRASRLGSFGPSRNLWGQCTLALHKHVCVESSRTSETMALDGLAHAVPLARQVFAQTFHVLQSYIEPKELRRACCATL